MPTASRHLPGVFFEAPTPVLEETLPRMDIAAFVGFASSGPLHLPVPVESPRRFRDLFGDDPLLAWDDERGEMRRAHLGGAVQAFFANGGLRCWIVRAADQAAAVRHAFAIPGLIAADDRNAAAPPLAQARARAAGTWCEALAVGTALTRDPLPLQSAPNLDPFVLAPGAYRVDLAADRSRVEAGDLLELTFGPAAPTLLLFAERVTPTAGGLRVESAGLSSGGSTIGAFWIQPPAGGSPAIAFDEIEETTPPIPLSESAGILMAQASSGSPGRRPAVRRLSFELLVWNGTELFRPLSGLTFGMRHPRFWAQLPTDDVLFWVEPGATGSREPEGLAREASSPRFPLAGPEGPAAQYYLPWGMGRSRTPDRAIPLPATSPATSTLERDGLAQFGAGLFLDRRLALVGAGALLNEAEHRLYVTADSGPRHDGHDVALLTESQRRLYTTGSRLAGLHSVFQVDEASLIAVPDAVHRGWSRELPPETFPLGAPELRPIGGPDAAARYALSWTAVETADGYTLQRDFDPAFPTAVVAFEDDALTAEVTLPLACPRDIFFRVRARRGGEIGPWSNTQSARLPKEDFAACDAARPAGLHLGFTGDAGSPGPALVWATEDPLAALPIESTIETATDPGFATAATFTSDTIAPGFAALSRRRVAARYYRVRGVEHGVYGPWSNTVRVVATERAVFTQPPSRDYDATALLALHRSMLRFAAARGDIIALLSLPDHYRTEDALEHVGRLTPGGLRDDAAAAPSSILSPRVAPLTEGETPVLSYGALYHPWTVARGSSDAEGPLRSLPPDGGIAGLMAAVALADGAWRAPANRPLVGVVALEPDLRAGSWSRLIDGGVNVLLNDVRGFLTLSEDTLHGEQALGRVHVRRLMILLRRLMLREGQRLVFEPHTVELQRRVGHYFERALGELFQRGAFAGADEDTAFRVITDDTINPPSSVDRGRLIVELRVAPAAALAYLTVRLVTAGAGQLAFEEA